MHAAISAPAASAASGQQGFAAGASGPEQQPADLADVPSRRPGPLVREIPQQVGRGGDPALLGGDQRCPLAYPGIFDELARLPFKRGQDGADRRAHARHYRGGVGIY
jgi:hypothetical protein